MDTFGEDNQALRIAEHNRVRALEALHRFYGYETFRGHQETAVVHAMDPLHPDLFLVFATGAGKSLCYQIPALLDDGVTFVVNLS